MKLSKSEMEGLRDLRLKRYKKIMSEIMAYHVRKEDPRTIAAMGLGLLDLACVAQAYLEGKDTSIEEIKGKFTISPQAQKFIDDYMKKN